MNIPNMVNYAKNFHGFKIVDLSLCIDEGFPLTWPSLPPVQKRTANWFERVEGSHGQVLVPSIGAFYSQALSIDEHTEHTSIIPRTTSRHRAPVYQMRASPAIGVETSIRLKICAAQQRS